MSFETGKKEKYQNRCKVNNVPMALHFIIKTVRRAPLYSLFIDGRVSNRNNHATQLGSESRPSDSSVLVFN